jgi:hypothetical protein
MMTALDPDKDVKLKNTGDRVGITCFPNGVSVPIDLVDFMTWINGPGGPGVSGGMVPHARSYSLDPTRLSDTANDSPSNWCLGTENYPMPSGIDHGSPGRANPPCTCTLFACIPWL